MSVPSVVEKVENLAGASNVPHPCIDGEPAWVVSRREEARLWLAVHGFPTRKHEDWRYLDLRPLLALPLALSSNPSRGLRDDIVDLLGPGLGGPRLVVLNGRFSPALSHLSEVPTGVRAGPMWTAAQNGGRSSRDPLGDLWMQTGGGWRDGFAALNAAFCECGALVEIADGARPDAPIEIVYLAVGDDLPTMSNPRTLIRAGAGAAVTVVETFIGAGGGPCFSNSQTDVVVGEGGEVEHYRFQAEEADAYHLSSVSVHAERTSRFASHLLATGARLGRHELRANMTAEGATIELDGLYLTGGDQCHDNPVRVEHAAPNCTSRQLYKGIVDGSGHGIFNGHVIVHPGASGTDAHQVNKNLLLSDRAEVDTRPRLEIFDDDVACTHGAAVGQLDPDAVFYLRSRGIAEPDARAMLVSGFAEDVIARFGEGPLRDRAVEIVAARLGTAVPEIVRADGGVR